MIFAPMNEARSCLHGAQSIRNAAENYIKKIADFLVGSKYEKMM